MATAFGADFNELRRSGLAGIVSLVLRVFSFTIGAIFAWFGGYTSAEDITTIGAGAVTLVVGPIAGRRSVPILP